MSGRLRLSLAVGALVGALVGVIAVAPGAGAAPKGQALVMPVQSKPEGRSYGEWSAAWWQWAYSMPIDHHPLFDTAGCSTGQSGHVWFLGATFQFENAPNGDINAIATRACTIPSGTFLFVPVLNSEASTLENNGSTEAELRAAAKTFQDAGQDMSISIDGASVPIDRYRMQSPLFTYGPLPDNNVLQFFGVTAAVAGSTSKAVGDGVYVMVKPLNVGTHVVHFSGAAPAVQFKLDITYNITVASGHH